MAEFRQALNDFYKTNGSDTRVHTPGPSMTRQEFADECDINKLMARYDQHVVGGPGNLSPVNPLYVDWADMPLDLMSYMDRMQQAEAAFMSLPAAVRKEFDNDAIAFVEFASDVGNLDQMRSWGLAPPAKPRPPEADEPPVAPPAAPPAQSST